MLLPLVTGVISIFTASAFLLMTVGPQLLDYIVCSSVFSVASWLYSFMIPAAFSYDPKKLGLVRLFQTLIVVVASAATWLIRPSEVAMAFIAMMAIDSFVFPAHMLLYRSQSDNYIRSEFVRNLAASVSLAVVVLFLGSSASAYAWLLAVNCAIAGMALFAAGLHRPPAIRLSALLTISEVRPHKLLTRQASAFLMSRILDVGALSILGRFDHMAAVLSLKMGIAVSTALSLSSRERSLKLLIVAHVAIYVAGSALAIALGRVHDLPVPQTLSVLSPISALAVIPLMLTSFVLSVHGFRVAEPDNIAISEEKD